MYNDPAQIKCLIVTPTIFHKGNNLKQMQSYLGMQAVIINIHIYLPTYE